jgi:hypothetical protein
MRRDLLVVLLALIPSTASAQIGAVPVSQRLSVGSQVGADVVVARLMSFDRNQDGRISPEELVDRMRPVVGRGDTSGDGMLDAAEIRAVAEVPGARKVGTGGSYTFGDVVGVPIRTRIANAIDDLRLPAAVGEHAGQIGETYARDVETAALATLRQTVAPMLTAAQLAEFEASAIAPGTARVFSMTTRTDGTVQDMVVVPAVQMQQLSRYQLSADQKRTAMAALLAYNADRQLDEARRSTLMTLFDGVLTDIEREDLDAALARRPLVKNTPVNGMVFAIQTMGRFQSAQ